MQCFVLLLFALIANVLLDGSFIPVLTHRANEVAVRPKLSAPELFFHLGALPEDFARRETFDSLHDLLRAIHWHRLDEKVDVILICPNFQKLNLVPLTDFQTGPAQALVNRFAEYSSAVLRRAN